jgi:hypothetical protein
MPVKSKEVLSQRTDDYRNWVEAFVEIGTEETLCSRVSSACGTAQLRASVTTIMRRDSTETGSLRIRLQKLPDLPSRSSGRLAPDHRH